MIFVFYNKLYIFNKVEIKLNYINKRNISFYYNKNTDDE